MFLVAYISARLSSQRITQVKLPMLISCENKCRSICIGWVAETWQVGANLKCSPWVWTQSEALLLCCEGWGCGRELLVNSFKQMLSLSWPIRLRETLQYAESFRTLNLIKADTMEMKETLDITVLEHWELCDCVRTCTWMRTGASVLLVKRLCVLILHRTDFVELSNKVG